MQAIVLFEFPSAQAELDKDTADSEPHLSQAHTAGEVILEHTDLRSILSSDSVFYEAHKHDFHQVLARENFLV